MSGISTDVAPLCRPYRACSVFSSLAQGGTRVREFALGYCLSGFQPFAATARSRQLLRLDSCSLAFIRG